MNRLKSFSKYVLLLVLVCMLPAAALAETAAFDGQRISSGHLSYTVKAFNPDAAFQRMEFKEYPGPVDGLLSESDTWTGFFRQGGRVITVDLSGQQKIYGVSLEFLQRKAHGITLPAYMEVSVSLDGKKWNYAGRVNHLVPLGDLEEQTRTLQLTFPVLEARYVQLRFPVDVWVFARHLVIHQVEHGEEELAADDRASRPVILAHQPQDKEQEGNYLQIPGVNDILLIYSGAHGELGVWTEEDFLPLVTYVDQEGNVRDSLFDTFLFLPFPEVESTRWRWQDYLNGLFQQGEQLDALNQLAMRLQQDYPQLKIRPKVILTLPYPDPKQESFYPGISFSSEQVGRSEALTNRMKAIRDYFHTLMSMWRAAKLDALDLAGIYWYKETMDATIPDEDKLVRYAAELVHEEGLKFYWIPYFGSKGYERWPEYGFDYVILQPNFYATNDPPKERMNNLAQLAKTYQLGVELEIDEKVTYNRFYYELFYEQLNLAKQLGMDQRVTNAYYMGAKTLLHTANSKLAPVRQIYDDLYLWIKGKYQP